MIQHFSFDHKGGTYHFKLNKNRLNGFSSLKNYLENLLKECPNSYFNDGPRGSSLKFDINDLKIFHTTNHEISEIARIGLEVNKEKYTNNHAKIQAFMIERDDKTIAIEVPIWLSKEELMDYSTIFKTDKPLTGHIDLLRIEDGKIWIWDYKLNAIKEKFAATQVYFYALMLSKRVNLPLENFRCGYFDEDNAFIFKPTKILH